jgi:hypothetical protein
MSGAVEVAIVLGVGWRLLGYPVVVDGIYIDNRIGLCTSPTVEWELALMADRRSSV